MRAGYGRGYYGEGQLARSAPRRRSWFTVVAVLGVGAAVVWLLWPRGSSPEPMYGGKESEAPPPPPPPSGAQIQISPPTSLLLQISAPAEASPPGVAVGAFLKQLEDDALLRGFSSTKEYEDSVIAIAKELGATGTKVMLAPHLQHLAPRLGSSAP